MTDTDQTEEFTGIAMSIAGSSTDAMRVNQMRMAAESEDMVIMIRVGAEEEGHEDFFDGVPADQRERVRTQAQGLNGKIVFEVQIRSDHQVPQDLLGSLFTALAVGCEQGEVAYANQNWTTPRSGEGR